MSVNPKYLNHSIYVLTNTVNGKQYIGATKDPRKRRIKHLSRSPNNRLIEIDVAQFGKGAFSFEVLAHNMTKAEALDLETKLCLEINPAYNLTKDGQPLSFPSGKNNPMKRPEARAKMMGKNNPAKQLGVRAKIKEAAIRRTPNRVLPQQKIDHIRYLRQNGLRVYVIASICQVHESTVSSYTKDLRSSKT